MVEIQLHGPLQFLLRFSNGALGFTLHSCYNANFVTDILFPFWKFGVCFLLSENQDQKFHFYHHVNGTIFWTNLSLISWCTGILPTTSLWIWAACCVCLIQRWRAFILSSCLQSWLLRAACCLPTRDCTKMKHGINDMTTGLWDI